MRSCITLYKSCLRTIAKNIALYKNDEYLQLLPNRMKCTVVETVTKIYNGFPDPLILQMLLNEQLETLDLSTSVVNEEILEDLTKCKKLTKLLLPSANGTDCTKETLCDLIPHLKNLEAFKLRNSDIVDDYVVSLLLKHCPNLDLLDLEQCSQITDDAMSDIAQMKLTKLNLSRTALSDNGLKAMESSPLENHLEDLNIKSCNVTCASLNYLRWDKIKYIGFEVNDVESKITPEPQKGTGMCWFQRDIILA